MGKKGENQVTGVLLNLGGTKFEKTFTGKNKVLRRRGKTNVGVIRRLIKRGWNTRKGGATNTRGGGGGPEEGVKFFQKKHAEIGPRRGQTGACF